MSSVPGRSKRISTNGAPVLISERSSRALRADKWDSGPDPPRPAAPPVGGARADVYTGGFRGHLAPTNRVDRPTPALALPLEGASLGWGVLLESGHAQAP